MGFPDAVLDFRAKLKSWSDKCRHHPHYAAYTFVGEQPNLCMVKAEVLMFIMHFSSAEPLTVLILSNDDPSRKR